MEDSIFDSITTTMEVTDDETPLVVEKYKKHKKKRRCVPYDKLMEYSPETCDLCPSIFHNLLDKYIHNAEHIIIPVQKNFSCSKCNSLFSTKNTFTSHNCTKLLKNKPKHKGVISSEVTDLKAAVLKDMFTKQPIVKCDNFISEVILNKNQKSQGKPSDKEPVLKDFCGKQLVVKCNNDSILKTILSSGKEASDETNHSKTPVECNNTGLRTVKPKPSSAFVEAILPDDYDGIVISDSESNSSSSDISLQRYSKRIDTSLVSLRKLENNDKGYKKEEYVPDFEYEDSNNPDFIKEFVNDTDAKLEFHDDLKNETVNEGLEDFIKNEMNSKDFELLFKSDVAFSESLKTKIIFEDDPDEFLNNDLIIPNKLPNIVQKLPNHLGEDKIETGNVHYSDLKYEEITSCKYCHKVFSNMYDLIIHETKHMKIKHRPQAVLCPVCSLYISGNYRTLTKHILRQHPLKRIKKRSKTKCKECNLFYYSYYHHIKHYHKKRICYICKEQFYDGEKFESHICGTDYKQKIEEQHRRKETYKKKQLYDVKLCEVCAMFKNDKYYRYAYIGTLCEVGRTFQCDECKKNFFELKKYMKCLKSFTTHIQKKQQKYEETDEKKKRLNNIWCRLKRIKDNNKK